MGASLLDKIRSTDSHVRVYALNGLAMALANEIEDTMFWCYLAASGLEWETAASKFYHCRRFADKQDLADDAVAKKVADTPHETIWAALNRRIQGLLGEGNSIRNLIGHNAVTTGVYVVSRSDEEHRVVLATRQTVEQKRAMVEFRDRPRTSVGEPELFDYCDKLIELYRDLEQFAEDVLQFGHRHRLRYALFDED